MKIGSEGDNHAKLIIPKEDLSKIVINNDEIESIFSSDDKFLDDFVEGKLLDENFVQSNRNLSASVNSEMHFDKENFNPFLKVELKEHETFEIAQE